MYQNFFGFTEKPFDVTPDPRFLYLSEHHQEALASILYGIRERRGFITLVGEVGTGKTTLLNATLESLDKSTQTAFIFNTDIRLEDLLQMVLMEFDLSTPDEYVPKYVALDRLNRFATQQFARGGNVALLIDEAQNLDIRTMENLRLLSNLETRRHKLIQIVLSGQPELDEKLRRKELRQLAQRINMRRYIMPLSESDTYQYILQHLDKAGFKGKPLFDRASLKQIWEFSGGVPRRINLLCDNTLLIAYGLGKKRITKAIVDEAITDLNWSPYETQNSGASQTRTSRKKQPEIRSFTQRHLETAAILLISLLLGAGSFGFLHMESDDIQRLSMRARAYIAGIWASSPADLQEETVPEPGTVASAYREAAKLPEPGPAWNPPEEPPGKAADTASAPESERTAESTEHARMVIHESPVSGNNRQMQQEPATPPRARKAPDPAPDWDLAVKKPKTPGLSPARREILEEDILTMPRASTPRSGDGSDTSGASATATTSGKRIFRTVIVRQHDHLSRIIQTNYGEISEDILKIVLEANPKIRDPDLILPGQVIYLPILGNGSGEISDRTGAAKKKLRINLSSSIRANTKKY